MSALDCMTTIQASELSLLIEEYEGKVDFALAFAVVHEVPDQIKLFEEIYLSMKPNALLLLSEPKGHVTQEEFDRAVAIAQATDFKIEAYVEIRRSRSVVLRK